MTQVAEGKVRLDGLSPEVMSAVSSGNAEVYVGIRSDADESVLEMNDESDDDDFQDCENEVNVELLEDQKIKRMLEIL
jgi:hypothetical protein